jgi:hypothetical protein
MQAFAEWSEVEPDVAAEAIANIRSGNVVALLGSGAQGSGKDTVVPAVLDRLGLVGVQCRVAHAIRAEMSAIIEVIAVCPDSDLAVADVAAAFDVGVDSAQLYVASFFERTRHGTDGIDVFERTEAMRRCLQWHGSEARADKVGYWVKRTYQSVIPELAAGNNVYLTDGRFPGEVDAGRTMGALCVRLFVPEADRVARIEARDGFRPSLESLRHPGETALEGYWGLDAEVDNTGPLADTVELIADMLAEHRLRLMTL